MAALRDGPRFSQALRAKYAAFEWQRPP